MSADKRIIVNMGEGAVRRAPAVIASVGLGSCVVLMLYDPGQRIGGLAHILLPNSPVHSSGECGQRYPDNWKRQRGENIAPPDKPVYLYADTALIALFKEMTCMGASSFNIYAMIAGGARMFSEDEPSVNGMGARNIMSIKKLLKREKISVIGEDTGGSQGRSVDFHLDSGRVMVRTVGGSIREIIDNV